MKFFANLIGSEEATESDPRKEVFLKLLQDSQENNCVKFSVLKVFQQRCFLVNLEK